MFRLQVRGLATDPVLWPPNVGYWGDSGNGLTGNVSVENGRMRFLEVRCNGPVTCVRRPTRSIRGVMLAMSLVLAGLAGTTADGNDTKPTRPSRIDWNTTPASTWFEITSDKPVLLAKVDGAGPYRFALHSTETVARIDDDIVRKLRLMPAGKEKTNSTDTDWHMPEVAHVSQLDVGGAALADLDFIVHDYDLDMRVYRRYEGSLGLSVFSDALLTVDYPRERIVLEQGQLPPTDEQEILDYRDDDGRAMVKVMFGDVPVEVALDTTSLATFVLPESLKGKIELTSETQGQDDGENGDGPAGESPRAKGIVRLGAHKLVQPPVRFEGDTALLGQLVLYHFAFTVDAKNHRIRFRNEDGGPISFESQPKYGFVVEKRAKGLVVTNIVPGTTAARGGLVPGDVVVEVDGRHMFSEAALHQALRTSDDALFKLERGGLPLLMRLDSRQ